MQSFEMGIGELVKFVIRSGSIDNRNSGKSRMQQGSLIHKEIQDVQSYSKDNFKKEVVIKHEYVYKDINFILSGRMDSLYTENEKIVIEEIKSTTEFKSDKFEAKEVHKAQLFVYGLFYCLQNDLSEIDLRLNYYHIPNEKSSFIDFHMTVEELRDYVEKLLDKWLEIGLIKTEWIKIRNDSISELPFIYESFRKGQRDMCLAVFNSIKRKNNVMIEAPTGIGKTVASLFPTIKSLERDSDKQIYYLTSKTTIQKEAEKALDLMRDSGLLIKSATITARDKICFLTQKEDQLRNCNPDDCKYAANFYEKLNDVLEECLKTHNTYDRKYIEEIAEKYEICPYQLSIELSNWSDIVICDYNYAFDPISMLQTFSNKKINLIDEAHNLADRSRSMYSAELSEKSFKDLERALQTKEGEDKPGTKGLRIATGRVVDFLDLAHSTFVPKKNDIRVLDNDFLDILVEKLFAFQQQAFLYLLKVQNKKLELDHEILDIYNVCSKSVYELLVISDFYKSHPNKYHFYIKSLNYSNSVVRMACLDASAFLSEIIKGSPTVLFSATLTPFNYYKDVILGTRDVPTLALSSPFNRDNYLVVCDNSISTRYLDRENSYKKIAEEIDILTRQKKGHYLIFFPSYIYLEAVLKEYRKINQDPETILVQDKEMSDTERQDFIERFKNDPDKLLVGFSVMGGVFSEGIDLPHDALIGTIIVGVGLPGLDYERDLIKDYFQHLNGEGYAYAYAYPGMNRVLQSAGRVIRTEDDKGIIFFIDERFGNNFYKRMLPEHLVPDFYNNTDEIEKSIQSFWK